MKLVTLQKMGVYFTLALIFITAVILLYIIINPFNLGPKPLQLLTIDELLGYNSSNPGKLIGVTVVNINEDAPNFYTYKVASADSTEYYVTSGYHYSFQPGEKVYLYIVPVSLKDEISYLIDQETGNHWLAKGYVILQQ